MVSFPHLWGYLFKYQLLRFHYKNVYANAPHCYIAHTMHIVSILSPRKASELNERSCTVSGADVCSRVLRTSMQTCLSFSGPLTDFLTTTDYATDSYLRPQEVRTHLSTSTTGTGKISCIPTHAICPAQHIISSTLHHSTTLRSKHSAHQSLLE
jgi:hypothetical protein